MKQIKPKGNLKHSKKLLLIATFLIFSLSFFVIDGNETSPNQKIKKTKFTIVNKKIKPKNQIIFLT